MPPVPVGAERNLESVLESSVPLGIFGIPPPSMRGSIESFNRQLGIAFYWGAEIASAPFRFWTEVYERTAKRLLLNDLLAQKSEFVVTRELNRAMYGAILDANTIHHNIDRVVGYGTIFGFEFLKLRSGLPAEQLDSVKASYTNKMYEGDKVSVKYTEGHFLPDDSLYLKGVGTRGEEVLATYEYMLRLLPSGREFPSVSTKGRPSTVPERATPKYTEEQLMKRVGMLWSTKLSMNMKSLKNVATVFDVLSGWKFSDFNLIFKNRDIAEIYVAGAISNAMATLGGEGTLFRGLDIQFFNPVEYTKGKVSVGVNLDDVKLSSDGQNFKLHFSGEAYQGGRLMARYAPFGLLPVIPKPS